MAGRTFVTGDIHGDLDALLLNLGQLPRLDAGDTLVFVGDYLNRGPKSAQVIELVRGLPQRTPAKVVLLRGNHEDGWLRAIDHGWPEFVLPAAHGCRETMESYVGPMRGELGRKQKRALCRGTFFPCEVVDWMRSLPYYYEDPHGIYVHAGLAKHGRRWLHPSQSKLPSALLWHRDDDFFRHYRGKRVIFGHTVTEYLPEELSQYTPEDPKDMWAGPCTIGLDTGALGGTIRLG
ncbi:MAG: serine/threonine protein phosphatase [Deltaproteobacteria bacterium]|nr:serine/threonine protein phosphatase [Deltaproteobacteria bacterium]